MTVHSCHGSYIRLVTRLDDSMTTRMSMRQWVHDVLGPSLGLTSPSRDVRYANGRCVPNVYRDVVTPLLCATGLGSATETENSIKKKTGKKWRRRREAKLAISNTKTKSKKKTQASRDRFPLVKTEIDSGDNIHIHDSCLFVSAPFVLHCRLGCFQRPGGTRSHAPRGGFTGCALCSGSRLDGPVLPVISGCS